MDEHIAMVTEYIEPDISSHAWLPNGVETIIACGSNNLIGIVDKTTVLKYPNLSPPSTTSNLETEEERIYRMIREEQTNGLLVESQMFEALGQHPRIVGFKGKHSEGILLENAHNGSVFSDMNTKGVFVPMDRRLKWALEATEGVAEMHRRGVLHCNIHPNNMLLDDNLQVKLCDFQGKLLNPDGTVRLDGLSSEDAKSSMPRSDPNSATRKTDIFALGSAIYFMIKGHLPFEELDSLDNAEQIAEKFRSHQFPSLDGFLAGNVVYKCWSGDYEIADEVESDLRSNSRLSFPVASLGVGRSKCRV